MLALPPANQLPGPGLIVSTATLNGPKKDALRAFVTATQHAMRDIEADPQKGVDAAIARIPELATDRPAQLAVLQATIALWESDYTRANGMGAVDPALWERSISYMASLTDKLLAKPVTAAGTLRQGDGSNALLVQSAAVTGFARSLSGRLAMNEIERFHRAGSTAPMPFVRV